MPLQAKEPNGLGCYGGKDRKPPYPIGVLPSQFGDVHAVHQIGSGCGDGGDRTVPPPSRKIENGRINLAGYQIGQRGGGAADWTALPYPYLRQDEDDPTKATRHRR